MSRILAVDLGGTKTTAAVVDLAGGSARIDEATRTTAPTPARDGADAVLSTLLRTARAALRARGSDIAGIGVATAGVVDTDRGTISHATSAITGWMGADVRGAVLREHPVLPVAVLNDVHAHGLGEALHGAQQPRRDLLLVAVGTGIGGALVLNGQVRSGVRGAAGHIGHISVAEADGIPCPCGRIGHLEGLASGPGILARARSLGAAPAATADGPALASAARDGDPAALTAYREAGRATGTVIGDLINVLDVETVALAGGVVGASPAWEEELRAGVAATVMDAVRSTTIARAARGNDAALLGAAEAARRML